MNNTQKEKQKKLLLVLPLLAIPFATMFFWALGGGRTAQAQSVSERKKGLNMKLPGAQLKNDSTANKLSFYEQAEKDSLKFKQARKDDPYYKSDTVKSNVRKDSLNLYDTGIMPKTYGNFGSGGFSHRPLNSTSTSLSADEEQINLKLAALNRQINQPSIPQQEQVGDRSEAEMNHMQSEIQKIGGANDPDPEMQRLSGMLDKIQEIQNPGLVQQKLKEQSQKNRGQVFAVSTSKRDNLVSTLDNYSQNGIYAPNGFFSLENIAVPDSQNSIEAVVHETQTLVTGSTVKLRLTNDVYINGVLIPKDNFVFGVAALNGERLVIKISSIRYHRSIYPVDLSVYDMDGADGIYIPGAITRDVAKESADQSIQNIGLDSYDQSLGAQAATAGITAAKTLFSRKVRLVKVTVKAGYQVLLRDEKQKQSNL